jgi:hypothetical protein
MLTLQKAFSLERFLETGTYRGMTAAWAAGNFDEVVTIEASSDLHDAARERHGHLPNVRWVHGDTRDVLPREVARLAGPAVVWLDSHWSGGTTYGEGDECPLLAEIETLCASPHPHHLFIDDARLFLAPPPPPHDADQWPTLVEVVTALTAGERPLEVFVIGDTFVAVPHEAKLFVRNFAQRSTGVGGARAVVATTFGARLRARLGRRARGATS